jgi:hypothetical protein
MDSAITAALGGAVTAAIDEALRNKHAQNTASFIDMNSPRKNKEPPDLATASLNHFPN